MYFKEPTLGTLSSLINSVEYVTMIAVSLGLSISSYLLLALTYLHNWTYSLSQYCNLPLDDLTTLKMTSDCVSIRSKYSLGTSNYC